jgi:hypothetical protein
MARSAVVTTHGRVIRPRSVYRVSTADQAPGKDGLVMIIQAVPPPWIRWEDSADPYTDAGNGECRDRITAHTSSARSLWLRPRKAIPEPRSKPIFAKPSCIGRSSPPTCRTQDLWRPNPDPSCHRAVGQRAVRGGGQRRAATRNPHLPLLAFTETLCAVSRLLPRVRALLPHAGPRARGSLGQQR